jgi:hydrogenase-4 membrane subunit HyfE
MEKNKLITLKRTPILIFIIYLMTMSIIPSNLNSSTRINIAIAFFIISTFLTLFIIMLERPKISRVIIFSIALFSTALILYISLNKH